MNRRIWSGSILLLLTAALVGCAKESPPGAEAPVPTESAADSQSKNHRHGSGPHGGTIADWGGGAYHVEFTVDHDKKEATVYILGGDAKSPAPIKAEKVQLSINEPSFQIDLVAQPLEGEGDGKSSRFVGRHDNLGIVREFDGTITGEVGGTPYAGDFQEAAGDHKH